MLSLTACLPQALLPDEPKACHPSRLVAAKVSLVTFFAERGEGLPDGTLNAAAVQAGHSAARPAAQISVQLAQMLCFRWGRVLGDRQPLTATCALSCTRCCPVSSVQATLCAV